MIATALDINNIASVTAAMQPQFVNLDLPDFTEAPEAVPEFVEPVQPPKLSFKQLAAPMIDRGIPVIPLRPRTKVAFLQNWEQLASTDPDQITAWDDENHEYNGACVAKSEIGGTWFFEVDDPEILKVIEEQTGKKMPETLTVCSSRGKHFYFEQNPASIKMGNLQGRGKDGKESWSARVDNRYVVAAGSIHPTSGRAYTVSSDAGLVSAPQWLTDWLSTNSIENQRNGDGVRVNASSDGPPIPHGSHDTELFRIACLLRNAGMDYEQIRDNLVTVCEKRCTGHGADYEGMCENKAKSACKYPVGQASPVAIVGGGTAGGAADPSAADVSGWRSQFRNLSEMEDGEIVMVIDGVLQEGTCFIGANPGHGKTLVALAFAKAICLGEPLFGLPEYTVNKPRNVIYLIPESGDRAFRKRGEAFRLPQDDRFIAVHHGECPSEGTTSIVAQYVHFIFLDDRP
jgi:hypothetical protein